MALKPYSRAHTKPSRPQNEDFQVARHQPRGASPFDHIFDRHRQMGNEMIGSMSSMFGGRGDPFANDPFFKEPFGQMDKMISNMRQAMAEPLEHRMKGMGQGQFMQMQTVTSSKQDQNGRPVRETYQTKAQGAFGQGNRVTERHQMYENTGNGHQKMAHERMINGQGRKVVRQRVGAHEESNDVYKNVRPGEGNAFDQEWENMAGRLGFNYQNNRLGYAGNDRGQGFGNYSGNQNHQQRQSQNERRADAFGIDNGRRGHYIPTNARAPNQPVAVQDQRRGRDIEPTAPGLSIHAPGNADRRRGGANSNAQQASIPLPLPSGNDVAGAPPRRQAQAAARVHRVPRQGGAQAKPARAG